MSVLGMLARGQKTWKFRPNLKVKKERKQLSKYTKQTSKSNYKTTTTKKQKKTEKETRCWIPQSSHQWVPSSKPLGGGSKQAQLSLLSLQDWSNKYQEFLGT